MDKLGSEDVFDADKKAGVSESITEISDNKITDLKKDASVVDVNNLTPIEAMNELNKLLIKIGEL